MNSKDLDASIYWAEASDEEWACAITPPDSDPPSSTVLHVAANVPTKDPSALEAWKHRVWAVIVHKVSLLVVCTSLS